MNNQNIHPQTTAAARASRAKSNSFDFGFQDGVKSQGLKNPIHNNWTGPHSDPDYEAGYWKGYLSGSGKWQAIKTLDD